MCRHVSKYIGTRGGVKCPLSLCVYFLKAVTQGYTCLYFSKCLNYRHRLSCPPFYMGSDSDLHADVAGTLLMELFPTPPAVVGM